MVEFTPFNDKIPIINRKEPAQEVGSYASKSEQKPTAVQSVDASRDFTQYLTDLERAVRETDPAWTSLTVPTVTGTSFDVTGIPTTAQEVKVLWKGITFSGADNIALQPLVGGVVDIADISSATRHTGTTSTTFILTMGGTVSGPTYGTQTLTKFSDIDSWSSTGMSVDSGSVSMAESVVGLIGTLDGIRIITVGGNSFTAGTVAVLYR